MSHDKILEFLRRDLGKSDMLLYLFETLIGLYSEAKVQNKEKDCKHGIFIGSPVSKDLCNYYLFLFLSNDEGDNYFCRSFFPEEKMDYSKNQASWTLLYKKKIDLSYHDSDG